MPPARTGQRTGWQRGLSTNFEAQEGPFTTGTIWDLISSLRVANDELKDLLSQERAPLSLSPVIMGMVEVSSSSKRRAVDAVDAVDTATQQETVCSTSSWNIHQSNSDRLDTPINEPRPSPEQHSSQISSSLSDLYSDHQALFNPIGLSDSHMDPLLIEQPQEEIEDRDKLDETMADFLRDTSNVTSDKTVDTENRCWEHGCNGRRFSTRSNLLRHQIEKGKARPNFKCPTCGAFFSRTTARNQHVAKKSCNRVRRYSNGRERPGPRVVDEG